MHQLRPATATTRALSLDEALATVPYSKTFEINGAERTYRFTEDDRISAARELLQRAADETARSNMTPEQKELVDLRKELGITQVEMAEEIGMPVRTYQTLENGTSITKPWHLKAARYAAIEWAAHHGHDSFAALLPRDIQENVRDVADLLKRAAK
jgi:DNA-binding XRE family transcriptional regulator